MKQATFKSNVESITYQDVLNLRVQKEKHPLKLEDLNISLKIGNEYVEVIREFLEALSFSSDRIDNVECRRRDGYIPHSYNEGGLEGICYRDQSSTCENTGFKNADEVLSQNAQYNLKCFAEENGLDVALYGEWTEEQLESWYNVESEYSQDDTIQFQARVMFTSETTANVDLYVSASDSPYHRKSDDRLELEIEFKSPKGLARKLKTILKHKFVQKFEQNVREGF